MLKRITIALAVVVTGLASQACPPKPADDSLPPAGLAGTPGQPVPSGIGGMVTPPPASGGPSSGPSSGPSAALTTLPGAGMNMGAPTGGPGGGGELPAGHPPLEGSEPSTGMPSAGNVQLTGTVVEVLEVTQYTYMKLKTPAATEEWTAVAKTPGIAVGDSVTVASQVEMVNFQSPSLNRTFPKLIMGSLVGAPKKASPN